MTLLWDVQAALVAGLTASLTVPVYDAGALVGDDAHVYLTVGDASGLGEIARADQAESALSGDYWRDETGEVPCSVEAWDGGTSLAPLRALAKPVLLAAITAVRADQTLGGLLGSDGRADVTTIRLREGQTERGALVQASFTVRYTALLT